jgi:molybdopterin synthase catalytic subunit
MARVQIQTADFDVGAETAALRAGDPAVGAVVSFVGTVRDRNPGYGEATRQGDIQALELEHYPGMTEASIEAMIEAALARFDIRAAKVIHRVGPLAPLDQIVLVLVSSAHRGQAFQACEFLMDYLKTQAPFWKKETTPAGAQWVDARVADDAALQRWGISAANAVAG